MKVLTGFIAFILTVSVYAQMNSMVYLKNGSALRGEITKEDSTGITLRTRDGSNWNYTPDEVLRIEKYSPEINKSGFYNKTSVGIIGGGDQVSASFRVVNGYSFNPH